MESWKFQLSIAVSNVHIGLLQRKQQAVDIVVMLPASTALAVEAGVVLSCSASRRLRTLAAMTTKPAASPREEIAAASVFMAATIDDNGIFGGPHVIVGWLRKCKTPKKIPYVRTKCRRTFRN